MTINDLKDKVISGGLITIDDALFLSEADLDDLCKAADEIQHQNLDEHVHHRTQPARFWK